MLNRRLLLLTSGAAALAGPATAQPAGPQRELGVLFDKLFEETLDEAPELVTSLGLDKGARASAKGRLSDRSIAGAERRRALNFDQMRRMKAIDRKALTGAAAVNYDSLLYDMEASEARASRFKYGDGAGPYLLSQINGIYQEAPDFLATQHTIETHADCEAYVARLEGLAVAMDQERERVRRDVGLGVIAPDFAVKGALASMTSMDVEPGKSSLVTSLAERAKAKGIAGDWQAKAEAAYSAKVKPALRAQMALLTELQGKSVHDAGCWRLPDGEAYYAGQLAGQTTTKLTPAEVHQLGVDVTRDLHARADVLFRKLGMTQGAVGARYDGLYKKKTEVYPNTDAAKTRLVGELNKLVKDMQARLPAYFGALPKTPLEIRRVPKETEQGASTHYSEGSLDGSRPGIYWINLRDTAESPFWWMPTTTFHEGVPGHHLQLTLQREAELPLIRKIQGFAAYSEGWALYSEQLAQEMGVYDGNPLWELGYIHDALLRSGRLVTDTGLHALRWSREKAIAELSRIDGDPPSLSAQEIERYAVTPGQACSYMVGKLAMIRLRDKAKAALGPRFDIRKFHDAVLLSGGMPLTVLETVVDNHIAGVRTA